MKIINLIITTILFCAGLKLSGCNNGYVSPVNSENTNNIQTAPNDYNSEIEYHCNIRLKPEQTYKFNYSNTGIRIFRSIDSPNCEELEGIIDIRGFRGDKVMFLECGSREFEAYSLQVKNLTFDIINVELIMSGSNSINPKQLEN